MGDAQGHVYAYNLPATGAPSSPTEYEIPNGQMAAGGQVFATTGDGTLNLIFPQTFSSNVIFGQRIALRKLQVDELNTTLAVDSASNVYAVGGPGLVVVHGVPGTTTSFATVTIPGAGPIFGLAVAPDGTIAIAQFDQFSSASSIIRFSSVATGAKEFGFIPDAGGPLAFDGAGRLFVVYQDVVAVYAANAVGQVQPIAVFRTLIKSGTLAIDANDTIYLLTTASSSPYVSAFHFNGTTFARLWSIPAPLYAQNLAVLQ